VYNADARRQNKIHSSRSIVRAYLQNVRVRDHRQRRRQLTTYIFVPSSIRHLR